MTCCRKLILGVLVAVLCAVSVSCCSAPPQIGGTSIEHLVAQKGAVLIAIKGMRCTNAIEQALSAHSIQHTTKYFSGKFQFDKNNKVWDWLDCKNPNDKFGGTVMHSYFFYNGKFVGQGFKAAEKVNKNPDKFKAKLVEAPDGVWVESNTEAALVRNSHATAKKAKKKKLNGTGKAGSKRSCATVKSSRSFIGQYKHIFKTGNRNAASHLWASYLIQRSACLNSAQFQKLNSQYCAISGSPLGGPAGMTCYSSRHSLASDTSKKVSGHEHHCCWPCYCDAKDWTAIDSKTIKLKDGSKKFQFFVIGDPCKKGDIPQSLSKDAPELKCEGGKLAGATMSDNGHVIIGMFYTEEKGQCHWAKAQKKLGSMCKARAKSGNKSGMGTIFIDLAKINPILKQER